MVYYIIAAFAGLICGLIISNLIFEHRTVIISDDMPADGKKVSIAMKLSNELAPYFKEDKDKKKIFIKVLKK